MNNLSRPIKITVCCDGFVSLLERPEDRRLGAALPVYSAWNMNEAVALIAAVCEWRPCRHGGKVGMTVEPRAPNWPVGADAGDNIALVKELEAIFAAKEAELYAALQEARRG